MADTRKIAQHLQRLAPLSQQLDLPADKRQQLWQAVYDYAERFLSQQDTLPAFVDGQYDKAQFKDQVIPEQGQPIAPLLALLQERVDTPGLNPASGGHLGYIPGGGLFPSALGDYLAAIFNRYAGLYFGSPGAVALENHLVDWMIELFGWPKTAAGNLASGGSIANLTALVAARDHRKITPENVRQQCIYLTQQVHHCVHKALRIAGLSFAQLRTIPMDDQFRMDVEALSQQIRSDQADGLTPMLLIASAGTTDTGAVDPLGELHQVAKENNIWFHVDAAYGGFFQLTEEGREKLKGIEAADSIVVDPHKGLFLPYGTGAVLVREASHLYASHYYQASYLQDAEMEGAPLSPADLSPELTKHFRGLRMWLPLQLYGLAPIRAALEEKLWLARYFATAIRQLPGFEIAIEPELSVVLFRYVPRSGTPNTANQRLLSAIHSDGRVFVSSTTVEQTFWLHLAVLSFRTHQPTIDTLLEVCRSVTADWD